MLVKKNLIVLEVVTLLDIRKNDLLKACKAAISKFEEKTHKVQTGMYSCVEFTHSGIFPVLDVNKNVEFMSDGPCEAYWVDSTTFIIYYVEFECV